MTRRMLIGLALCLFTLPLLAGNRADLNADHSVNSADLVLMANLQAGNMDIGPYNLSNVVVVAPQGGDFTDPAAAADWVTSQVPSSTRRFVILVTPGTYELTRQLNLPAYTTLKGYGAGNTILHWSGLAGSGWQNGIYVYEGTGVEIRDLAIRYAMIGNDATSTHVGLMVYVRDQLVFSGLDIRMEPVANSAHRYAVMCNGVTSGSFLRFHSCHFASHCQAGQGDALGIYYQANSDDLTNVAMEMDSCQLDVYGETSYAYAFQVYGPVSATVRNSEVEVSGASSQRAFYLLSNSSSLKVQGSSVLAQGNSSSYCWSQASGQARFQGCTLKGAVNNPVKLVGCCDVDFNLVN